MNKTFIGIVIIILLITTGHISNYYSVVAIREMINGNRKLFNLEDNNETIDYRYPFIVSLISPIPGTTGNITSTNGCWT